MVYVFTNESPRAMWLRVLFLAVAVIGVSALATDFFSAPGSRPTPFSWIGISAMVVMNLITTHGLTMYVQRIEVDDQTIRYSGSKKGPVIEHRLDEIESLTYQNVFLGRMVFRVTFRNSNDVIEFDRLWDNRRALAQLLKEGSGKAFVDGRAPSPALAEQRDHAPRTG